MYAHLECLSMDPHLTTKSLKGGIVGTILHRQARTGCILFIFVPGCRVGEADKIITLTMGYIIF